MMTRQEQFANPFLTSKVKSTIVGGGGVDEGKKER
jgi:hypothetical protein